MKTKFFNLIKIAYYAILSFLNLKFKIDSKKVRRTMYQFFNIEDWSYYTSITKIDVYKEKKRLLIIVETHRPGLLIGKGGSTINALIDRLKEELKTDVKISIRECKLWSNLY